RSERHGGGFYAASRASQLENTRATFLRCEFLGNTAAKLGGAGANDDASIITMDQCRFEGNRAGLGGGALANQRRAELLLKSCVFRQNASDRGEPDVAADETARVRREQPSSPRRLHQVVFSDRRGGGRNAAQRAGGCLAFPWS
ncbi:MAG: hypothetical protein J7M29_10395, partial [Verrucomicrobia bacterium]|nr:hypothetical protein [Verrucomicrobiota bacterium]